MLNISRLQNINHKIQAMQNEINILKNASNLRVNNARIPFDNVDVHDKITWDKVISVGRTTDSAVTTSASPLPFTKTIIIDSDFYTLGVSLITIKVPGRYLITYTVGGYKGTPGAGYMWAYLWDVTARAYIQGTFVGISTSTDGIRSSASAHQIVECEAAQQYQIIVDTDVNGWWLDDEYVKMTIRKLKPGDIQ